MFKRHSRGRVWLFYGIKKTMRTLITCISFNAKLLRRGPWLLDMRARWKLIILYTEADSGMKEVFCQFFDYSKAFWLLSRLPAITRAPESERLAERVFRREKDVGRQRRERRRRERKVGKRERGSSDRMRWTSRPPLFLFFFFFTNTSVINGKRWYGRVRVMRRDEKRQWDSFGAALCRIVLPGRLKKRRSDVCRG